MTALAISSCCLICFAYLLGHRRGWDDAMGNVQAAIREGKLR